MLSMYENGVNYDFNSFGTFEDVKQELAELKMMTRVTNVRKQIECTQEGAWLVVGTSINPLKGTKQKITSYGRSTKTISHSVSVNKQNCFEENHFFENQKPKVTIEFPDDNESEHATHPTNVTITEVTSSPNHYDNNSTRNSHDGFDVTINKTNPKLPHIEKKQTSVIRLGESTVVNLNPFKENNFDGINKIEKDLIVKSDNNVNTEKKARRVGFSKTEVHFEPEGGKFKLVETDGKQPPTQCYRRKRRNKKTGSGLKVYFGSNDICSQPQTIESSLKFVGTKLNDKTVDLITNKGLDNSFQTLDGNDKFSDDHLSNKFNVDHKIANQETDINDESLITNNTLNDQQFNDKIYVNSKILNKDSYTNNQSFTKSNKTSNENLTNNVNTDFKIFNRKNDITNHHLLMRNNKLHEQLNDKIYVNSNHLNRGSDGTNLSLVKNNKVNYNLLPNKSDVNSKNFSQAKGLTKTVINKVSREFLTDGSNSKRDNNKKDNNCSKVNISMSDKQVAYLNNINPKLRNLIENSERIILGNINGTNEKTANLESKKSAPIKQKYVNGQLVKERPTTNLKSFNKAKYVNISNNVDDVQNKNSTNKQTVNNTRVLVNTSTSDKYNSGKRNANTSIKRLNIDKQSQLNVKHNSSCILTEKIKTESKLKNDENFNYRIRRGREPLKSFEKVSNGWQRLMYVNPENTKINAQCSKFAQKRNFQQLSEVKQTNTTGKDVDVKFKDKSQVQHKLVEKSIPSLVKNKSSNLNYKKSFSLSKEHLKSARLVQQTLKAKEPKSNQNTLERKSRKIPRVCSESTMAYRAKIQSNQKLNIKSLNQSRVRKDSDHSDDSQIRADNEVSAYMYKFMHLGTMSDLHDCTSMSGSYIEIRDDDDDDNNIDTTTHPSRPTELNIQPQSPQQMVSFVASDLEVRLKLSSPPGVAMSPLAVLAEIEADALRLSTCLDSTVESLAGVLRGISALTADSLETYRDAVTKTCDAVDSNVRSAYQLMAKCDELKEAMKPVYKQAQRIGKIKHLLDLLEAQGV